MFALLFKGGVEVGGGGGNRNVPLYRSSCSLHSINLASNNFKFEIRGHVKLFGDFQF